MVASNRICEEHAGELAALVALRSGAFAISDEELVTDKHRQRSPRRVVNYSPCA